MGNPANFQEFPKMLYKLGKATEYQVVNSQAEEDALGDDWIDSVIDPDAPDAVVE
jgi:hypothetical protein